MKIRNIAGGPRGVNTLTGPVIIPAGGEADVELSPAEHGVSSGTGWFEIDGEPAEEAEPEDDAVVGSTGYTVVDNGRGWFSVALDGAEMTRNMRAADLEGFDAMSEDDKAAFVEAHKAD